MNEEDTNDESLDVDFTRAKVKTEKRVKNMQTHHR